MGGLRSAIPLATTFLTAVLAGAALMPGVAAADVTVTPSTGVQGSALRLAFTVSEDRPPAYTVQVELRLPQAAPIAEVYPLSVPDWAPRTVMRTLDRPVSSLHGVETTEVVSSITWIRVKQPRGAQPSELPVALGPLPSADQAVFTVIQTYSDGTVVTFADTKQPDGTPDENPAPVVNLRPPEPGSRPLHVDHADSSGGSAQAGGGLGMLYSVLLGGLAAGALWLGWTLLDRRRALASTGPVDITNPTDDANANGDGSTVAVRSIADDRPVP
jgi:uncharacterized protein YcnI